MPQREPDTREQPEDERPRDRAPTLSEAILEISASLDLDTVVRKVVEEARSLTGARLGIIATIDECGDAPGSGAARRGRTDANGVPGAREPRAARAAHGDQGSGGDADGGAGRARPGRDARVLPHHRRAGGSDARSHLGSPRHGAHRLGHPLGLARAVGGDGPGGRGEKRLPDRRQPARPRRRPRRRPAARDGGPAARRAGAEQPARERRPAHAGVGRHPRGGRARRAACRDLGGR